MTLFDVARKNVAGNFRSYFLYFGSLVFCVVIFYTFVSMQYSGDIARSIRSSQAIRGVFTQASVILFLFAAIFIWYSNSFFMRKRKKEIGLYSLLGLRKRTIGRMLFYENLIMGAAGMIAGIVLGTLLSRLFAMLLVKLLDSAVQVSFGISGGAVLYTLIVFAVLILFTSFQAYRLIYRFKLIELFRAEKEGELAPKGSAIAALAAVLLLAASYWTAFQPMTTTAQMGRNMLIIMLGIASGTYLLFRSTVAWLLRAARADKSRFYRGINIVVTSQLLYRIRGNTRMLTLIALLSAVALSAVSVGASSYYSAGENAAEAAPFNYSYISQGEPFDGEVEAVLNADKAHPVEAELDVPAVKLEGDISSLPYIPDNFPADKSPLKVISASMYNRASELLGREGKLSLAEDEAALIRPMYTSDLANADYKGASIGLPAGGSNARLTVSGLLDGRVMRWGYPDMTVVVSDAMFGRLSQDRAPVVYKLYNVANARTADAGWERLKALAEGKPEAEMASYYAVYRENIEEGGVNIFILGFLGLVFLAATGSVIYFKQLTEAQADADRYAILRKVGVSRKEVRSAVARQTLFIFGLPLVVALGHSAMILEALASINLIVGDLTVPIVASMTVYALVYLIYYAAAVGSFNKIVNK